MGNLILRGHLLSEAVQPRVIFLFHGVPALFFFKLQDGSLQRFHHLRGLHRLFDIVDGGETDG